MTASDLTSFRCFVVGGGSLRYLEQLSWALQAPCVPGLAIVTIRYFRCHHEANLKEIQYVVKLIFYCIGIRTDLDGAFENADSSAISEHKQIKILNFTRN